MSGEQFEKIVAALRTSYPNKNVFSDVEAVRFWFSMLKDLEYGLVHNAVLDIISTSIFPPSIAEIREKCTRRTMELPEWGEAWEKAIKAVKKYGSYQELEALDSLDEVTKRAVQQVGYKTLCLSDYEDEGTYRAQFRDIYTIMAKRSLQEKQIPSGVMQMREEIKRQHLSNREIVKIEKQETVPFTKSGQVSETVNQQIQDAKRRLKGAM